MARINSATMARPRPLPPGRERPRSARQKRSKAWARSIPFIAWMAVGAALSVVLGIAIANTLIPALLGFAGHNIDRWRIGRARTGHGEEAKQTLSGRWAKRVTERPGVALAAGLGVMLLLAVPMFSMRLGMTDAGTDPPSTTTRQAYDLVSDGFGPGFNGPLLLVTDLSGSADPEAALTELNNAEQLDDDTDSDPALQPA